MPRKQTETEMSEARLSTGIPGLDEILYGGLVPKRAYLIRGGPGTGKSTFGLHFLTNGAARGEKVLFITMGEPEAEVRKNARSMGFDLDGVEFLDLAPTPESFAEEATYDIFSPAEVERGPITQRITGAVESLKPTRVFVDSATQFRYLIADAFQFRKQMLSLARYLIEQGATVVFSSEGTAETPDNDLQFLCDGVINLELGPEGRVVGVTKFRGSGFQGGYNSMRLGDKGMEVFPRLVPGEYYREFVVEPLPFGVAELDKLLHGGLERGTVTIITGPAGVGKTSLGVQFVKEAAGRGEPSVVYSFEEGRDTMLRRCEGINIRVRAPIEKGTLSIVQVEPLHYTPDEFAQLVRHEVETQSARIVMIDSVSGYRLSLCGRELVSHLHALCRYLRNMGVTAILVNEVESITGEFRATEFGISYLVDNIIFLRYVEVEGQMRRTIGVLKKRISNFDKTLREFEITSRGIKVGEKFALLGGILGGMGYMRSLLVGRGR
jgi:circadian clock protein KaiC